MPRFVVLSSLLFACSPVAVVPQPAPIDEEPAAPPTLESFAAAQASNTCDAFATCGTPNSLMEGTGCESGGDPSAAIQDMIDRCVDFDPTIAEVCLSEAPTCFHESMLDVDIPVMPAACQEVCASWLPREDDDEPQPPTVPAPPTVPTFSLTGNGLGVELEVDGRAGTYRMGWVVTGAPNADASWSAEDCDGMVNANGEDYCHPLSARYLELEDSNRVDPGSESRLAGYYNLYPQQFTVLVEDTVTDECWVWGHDTAWYTDFGFDHCTVVAP